MQHKKQFVLEEAMILFMEKGYVRTSMQDIAERCNISKATLYKFFEGKEDIALRGMFYKTEQMLEMIDNIMYNETFADGELLYNSIIIRMKEFAVRNQFLDELATVFSLEQWRKYLPEIKKIKYTVLNRFSHIIMKSFNITDEILAAESAIQLNGLIREFTEISVNGELVFDERLIAEYIVDVLQATVAKRKTKTHLFTSEQLDMVKSAMEKSNKQVSTALYKKKLIYALNRAMNDYEKQGKTNSLDEVQLALNGLKELEREETEEN